MLKLGSAYSKAPAGKKQRVEMGQSRTERGFSLIEVNLAIFVVAVGLLTLFSLFPVGLKQGQAGHEDTQTSMFADFVLDGMRANAMSIDATDWKSVNVMEGASSPLLADLAPGGGRLKQNTLGNSMEYPTGADPKTYIRHVLRIDYDNDGDSGDSRLNLYKVTLWVQGTQYGSTDVGDFKGAAEVFYTELFYSGMP